MSFFTPQIAIDLGTVNVLVHVQGRGVVLQEPSVVAIREDGNRTIIVEVGPVSYTHLTLPTSDLV